MPYRLVTLVYAVRDGRILLIRRRKPPYVGHWVAPSGKVEPGESPRAGALRELREETGLEAREIELRAVVTETSGRPDWQWLIFIYRALEPTGAVVSDGREGELAWFAVGGLEDTKIPPADRVFMPLVLGSDPGVHEMHFTYSDNLEILSSRID